MNGKMGCGCSCGKGTPVSDPLVVVGSPIRPQDGAPQEFVEEVVPALDGVDEAELERKEKEALEAQRERDKKARERREEQERRSALAKKLQEQKHREELAAADALERRLDGGDNASSDETESSSEEEDDMPTFLMGKRVKLRDPARGKMRRTKINLNSGYVKKSTKNTPPSEKRTTLFTLEAEAALTWVEPSLIYHYSHVYI